MVDVAADEWTLDILLMGGKKMSLVYQTNSKTLRSHSNAEDIMS